MTRRGWLLFAAMGLIWGIPYLLIKVAVGDLSPATLVFFRTFIGATLLLPIAALRGNLGPLRAHWKIVVVYTLIEVALPWFLLADAERRLSSSFSHLAWRKQATLSAKLHRQPQGNIDVLDRRLR